MDIRVQRDIEKIYSDAAYAYKKSINDYTQASIKRFCNYNAADYGEIERVISKIPSVDSAQERARKAATKIINETPLTYFDREKLFSGLVTLQRNSRRKMRMAFYDATQALQPLLLLCKVSSSLRDASEALRALARHDALRTWLTLIRRSDIEKSRYCKRDIRKE